MKSADCVGLLECINGSSGSVSWRNEVLLRNEVGGEVDEGAVGTARAGFDGGVTRSSGPEGDMVESSVVRPWDQEERIPDAFIFPETCVNEGVSQISNNMMVSLTDVGGDSLMNEDEGFSCLALFEKATVDLRLVQGVGDSY